MGSNNSKSSTYPISISGLGSNTNWTVNATENIIEFQPYPAEPNKSFPPGCVANGVYDYNTNVLTYSISCPDSTQKQTLQNCTVDPVPGGIAKITCPIPENIEAVNQFKSKFESATSYQENVNDNSWVWIIVVAFIFLALILISRK